MAHRLDVSVSPSEVTSPFSRNKPLPRLPTKLPGHAAASLLTLLDSCDAELVLHVSRVQADIKESSIDEQTSQQLQAKLANRPEKATLIEKNILKGTNIAF
ncbi:hypothetical protein B0H15DRAFT_954346 [Mycena belliarum]|uniref:Uncharacterized protein n=1 Tax=Mycena belliarum TaxID=1033014 RepID=A0AAD6TWQ9_9AGAR|nr:hypothetical protein B0H15DRAFT_954346 [Mycena belliae]